MNRKGLGVFVRRGSFFQKAAGRSGSGGSGLGAGREGFTRAGCLNTKGAPQDPDFQGKVMRLQFPVGVPKRI